MLPAVGSGMPPTVTAPDGETIHLTPAQRDALAIVCRLPPDALEMLVGLAEQMISEQPEPRPRVTHLRILSPDGHVVYPIACRRRLMARNRGDDRSTWPRCSWRPDEKAGGYVCQTGDCRNWIGPDMLRAAVLDSLFADGGEEDPS